MKKINQYFLAFCVFIALPFLSNAQIIINTNTTWSTDQFLSQLVIIEDGSTLTIEEGVLVQTLFVDISNDQIGEAGIQVNGELVINGTAGNPVVFEPFSATNNNSDWMGIVFNSNSANNSINYLDISYAHIGLEVVSEASFHGVRIHDCTRGVVVHGAGNATFTNSTIDENIKEGMFVDDGMLGLMNSTIMNNGRFGVVNSSGTITVDTCVVETNSWGGIYIGGNGTTTVLFSEIHDNTGSGFEISEFKFSWSNGFDGSGTKENPPSITVNHCNIYNNSNSSNTLLTSTSDAFVTISNWGTCSSPRSASDGESDVFEIPMGYISSQQVKAIRYNGSSNSTFNRTYKLRNVYTNADLSSTTVTFGGTSCGSSYSWRERTFRSL